MTTSTNQQPVVKFREDDVSVAIWEKQGEYGVFYTTTLTRRYKDGDEYKDSNSYNRKQLKKARRLLKKADKKERDLIAKAKADAADGDQQ